jgi:hypothetical protein
MSVLRAGARLRWLLLLVPLMLALCPVRSARAEEAGGGAADLAALGAEAGPGKEQCVDANGLGQELRRTGKLAAAREQLRACAHPACPALVRDDCTLRLDELERAQPTIAFSVQDAAGRDLSQVTVRIDGKTLATRLDGTALPVDIGQHTFQFEAEGHAAVTRAFIVIEGEKLRHERVVLVDPGAELAQPTPASGAARPRAETDPARTPLGAHKLSGVITGAVGVALLISGTAFGVVASSRWSAAEDACPTHMQCSAQAMEDRDGAAKYATLSTVGLVSGGVLAALGVTLFLTAPKAARSHVTLALAPNSLRVRGAF